MMKVGREQLEKNLHKIVQIAWAKGQIPNALKIAPIYLLRKTVQITPNTNCKNYRCKHY